MCSQGVRTISLRDSEMRGSYKKKRQNCTVRKAKMRITFAMDWEEMTWLQWMECVGVLRIEMETVGHRPEKAFSARPRCFLCIAQVTRRYWRFMSKKPCTVSGKWSRQCGVQGPWNMAPQRTLQPHLWPLTSLPMSLPNKNGTCSSPCTPGKFSPCSLCSC